MTGQFKSIHVGKILIPEERLRMLHQPTIDGLAASISEAGLLNPVTVYRTARSERSYTLISGARRLRAVEQLGHS